MARKPAPPGGDRRQRILEAALALFAEQGLEGATSKDIAERAEVTHGLIYFYFKTKEDLFKAAFEYALERALDELDLDAIAQSDEAPEQALGHLLTRLLETFTSPVVLSMSRLMMHTMAHTDWRAGPLHECKQHVHATIRLAVTAVSEYLDRQVALGRLQPVNTEIVARFLVGGVASSVRWSQVEGRAAEYAAYDSRETAMTIADAVVRGLLVTPSEAPPDTPPEAASEAAPDPLADAPPAQAKAEKPRRMAAHEALALALAEE